MDASARVSIDHTSCGAQDPSPRFNPLEYLSELIGTGFNLFVGLSAAVLHANLQMILQINRHQAIHFRENPRLSIVQRIVEIKYPGGLHCGSKQTKGRHSRPGYHSATTLLHDVLFKLTDQELLLGNLFAY